MTSVSARMRAAAALLGGVAGLLLAGSGFGTGGGDRCFRAGAGGADRRGGIGRCGCGAGFGMAGACPGRLLQAAGGVEGLEGGLQFLAGFGGLGVRDDGGCLGTAPAGVGISELRADMRRVEQRGFSAGVPGQRGGLPQQGLQPGQRVTVRSCRQALCLGGHGAGVRAAGAGGAGGVVVSASARIAAVLPRPAVAGLGNGGAAARPAAVQHLVTGLPGSMSGGLIGHHDDPFLSFPRTVK